MILIKIIGVLLLLIALLFIYGFISDKISEKKHREFKKKLEGKALFITTNKKDFESLNYRILQKLDKEIIHVKLVNGRVKSIYDADKIHRLISFEKLKKFPITVKVRNNTIIYKSFYDDFNETSKQDLDEEILQDKVSSWFKEVTI